MLIYDVLIKNKKIPAYIDLLQGLTGLGLAVFLHFHMLFVSTIHLGAKFYDGVPEFLDGYYLAHIGIPPVIILFFMHFLLAARRIPVRFREQSMVIKHSGHMRHLSTWMWVVQVVTGMSILILGSIHMFVILADWPISSTVSINRVNNPVFLGFYIFLATMGMIHTYIGLYRLILKWVGAYRKTAVKVLFIIGICTVTLSFFSLYTFTQMQ